MEKFIHVYQGKPWHRNPVHSNARLVESSTLDSASDSESSASGASERFENLFPGKPASYGTGYVIVSVRTREILRQLLFTLVFSGDSAKSESQASQQWSSRMLVHAKSHLFQKYKEIRFYKVLERASIEAIRYWEFSTVYAKLNRCQNSLVQFIAQEGDWQLDFSEEDIQMHEAGAAGYRRLNRNSFAGFSVTRNVSSFLLLIGLAQEYINQGDYSTKLKNELLELNMKMETLRATESTCQASKTSLDAKYQECMGENGHKKSAIEDLEDEAKKLAKKLGENWMTSDSRTIRKTTLWSLCKRILLKNLPKKSLKKTSNSSAQIKQSTKSCS
uniref:Uncharacterized protein n=1 Tax=Ditylenchus dipsaci TaxID=166011 RepID=A0A915E3F9_9BILA